MEARLEQHAHGRRERVAGNRSWYQTVLRCRQDEHWLAVTWAAAIEQPAHRTSLKTTDSATHARPDQVQGSKIAGPGVALAHRANDADNIA